MKIRSKTLVCLVISAADAFSSIKLSSLKPKSIRLYSNRANVEEKGAEINDAGTKPCFWKSPDGMCRTSQGDFTPVTGGWKQRVRLEDLKVGQKLIGQKISKADLLQAKTGPKIFYECGVGRIDAKNNWQMVSGMLRVAKSFDKPSVVRKKVARLSGKPVELFVHKISLDNCRLEVKLSLDESKDNLEKETKKIPASNLKEGQELVGKIVQLRPYGAIIDVGANRNGLLHIQRVADLFDKYIDKEKGLEEAGLERGASIKVAVISNERKKMFLDFTRETKDLAAEEAELMKKEAEAEAAAAEIEAAEAAAAEAAAAFGFDVEDKDEEDATFNISDDEAAAWAAYADDFEDDNGDYDEDADIEDSLGIGSY